MAFEFASKEIIIGLVVILIIFGAPVILIKNITIKVAFTIILILLAIFWLQFFRDPDRVPQELANAILSPADGKIVEIENVFEEQITKRNMTKIGIFMSPFNCHINRIPISGVVENLIYSPGRKLPAYTNQAKHLNENMITHIKNGTIDILVKQIAGIFARRIKNKLRPAMKVKQGEKFGMILIGSKTEIYIPQENIDKITIAINDKVKAGQSILAIIK